MTTNPAPAASGAADTVNATGSSPAMARTLVHTRRVQHECYRREDGLWDIESVLRDHRGYDSNTSERACIPAGEPIHLMRICMTVDDAMTVRGIEVQMEAVPFAECQQTRAVLQTLVGVPLAGGWRKAVEQRMGGIAGCTHLRELLFAMATAAYQTVPVYHWQRVRRGEAPPPPPGYRPPHLDSCMTWDSRGPVVQRIFGHEAETRAD